jgi:hypothetical protein
MRHQLALYFVPNFGKTRVKFLSKLLFFHRPSLLDGHG